MGTDASTVFHRLLHELEDWYADSVRARAYDADSAAPEAGHAILMRNKYPGPDWRKLWRDTSSVDGRMEILRALEDEIYGLSHGPSQASPASGLHRGTREWRLAVGSADGSLRTVARRFGVSHTEVRRLRAEVAGSLT